MKRICFLLLPVLYLSPSDIASAEPAAGITMTCVATGPGIATCSATGVLLHEGVQAANGKEAFGRNGEIMKIIDSLTIANLTAAKNESGELSKLIRAITAISITDIEKYGLLGGDNSFLRKNLGLR